MFSVSFESTMSGEREHHGARKSGGESFNVLLKLKEILHHKDVQTALHKLGMYSSDQNLSESVGASGSKLKRTDELKSEEEIGRFDGMKEEDQREMRVVMNGRKLLTESSASNSNEIVKMELANSSGRQAYLNSRKTKVMQNSEMDELSERLKILEEENKMMKQEFLEQVEERKQLVNEIYQHFQAIYRCLQFENSEYGERSSDEYYIMNPREEGGLDTGLSGSYIVAREDNRTNFMALRENPEE